MAPHAQPPVCTHASSSPRDRARPAAGSGSASRCGILAAILVLGAAAGLTVLAGCRSKGFQEEIETPPLFLRRAVPDDSAIVALGRPVDFTFEFNRPTVPQAIHLEMVPPPLSAGSIDTVGSGRSVTWFDVVLDPSTSHSIDLLVDSPQMLAPRLFHFNLDQREHGAVSGCVTLKREGFSPEGARVAALPTPPGFEGRIEELANLVPLSLALVSAQPQICSSGFWYRLTDLTPGREVFVLAILDTSGDGLYDVHHDWWGVVRPPGASFPTTLVAGCTFGRVLSGECAVAETTGADLELVPPLP